MDWFAAPDRLDAERFTLRSWLPGDGAALHEAAEASREHLHRWMPWSRAEASPADRERIVREARGKYLLSQDFLLSIWAPDGSRVLGGSGFHPRGEPLSMHKAEIGLWIRAEMAGRGLGTEVLRALLEWGFTAWPWRRLAWRCDPHNHASARVAENARMRQEGVLRAWNTDGEEPRDTVVFALLRGDPR